MRKQVRAIYLVLSCTVSCAIWTTLFLSVPPAPGQVTPPGETPLYQREPFDRLTLDAANGNAVFEIRPLPLPDRSAGVPRSGPKLRIQLLQDPPEKKYDVAWTSIAAVELFEQMLLDQAAERIRERDFDTASLYLQRLTRDYPRLPQLAGVLDKFYIADALELYRQERFEESLLSLAAAYQQPQRPAGIESAINRVVDKMVEQQVNATDLGEVRRRLELARGRFGEILAPTIEKWDRQLKKEAEERFAAAQDYFQTGLFPQAFAAARTARDIWPQLNGLDAFYARILAAYPRVTVAVTQRYAGADPPGGHENPPPIDWARRRTRSLLWRQAVKFQEFTAEGSDYRCELGKTEVDDDLRGLQLTLPASKSEAFEIPPLSDLGRAWLEQANAAHGVNPDGNFEASLWAEYLANIEAITPYQLRVSLRRPYLLPLTLLPEITSSMRANAPSLQALTAGDYIPTTDRIESPAATLTSPAPPGSSATAVEREPSPREAASRRASGEPAVFVRRAGDATTGIREVVEQYYPDSASAGRALAGDGVDMIDRVFPADVSRLRSRTDLTVRAYRAPSIHFLTINPRQKLLGDDTFRRGLLYAIDRQGILNQELLGGEALEGCRVISAPLPAGRDGQDPIGFAYDNQLAPRPHDPLLSLILMELARSQAETEAPGDAGSADEAVVAAPRPDDRGTGGRGAQESAARAPSTPEQRLPAEAATVGPAAAASPSRLTNRLDPRKALPTLVLAHPASEVTRMASLGIQASLQRVGVVCQLRELAPGVVIPEDADWDLLYVDAVVQDPFVDVPALLLDARLVPAPSSHLRDALRQVYESTNWQIARERLQRVHRLLNEQLPVFPLWQLTDYMAFRNELVGLAARPVTLYDEVRTWRYDVQAGLESRQ